MGRGRAVLPWVVGMVSGWGSRGRDGGEAVGLFVGVKVW